MIAKNLLKFAEALALQLPLPFTRLRMLKQARPTTRAGRIARAARAPERRALLSIKVRYIAKTVFKAIKRTTEAACVQLSLFSNRHTLLATKAGHIWVQSELLI